MKGEHHVVHTRRLADWDPEDAAAWRAGNHVIARRNLIWAIATVHVASSIWYLWSVMVLFMPQSVYGFKPGDKLLLTATAILVGALARIPYTIAAAKFGGRNWATFSSAVLLVPTVGTMVLLAHPGLPLWPYLVCAALTGLGGGNYSASLTTADALYPNRRKGLALGLTGGVADLGAATIQVVGLLALASASASHAAPYWICAIYLVLLAVVGVGTALRMDNFFRHVNVADLRSVLRVPDTWVISLLYMIASGSFLGFAFAFGQVLQINFIDRGQSHAQAALHAAEIAFVGPMLGSVARVVGGALSDHFGGGRVTLGVFGAATLAGGLLAGASSHDDLVHGPGGPVSSLTMTCYIIAFIALFVFCGAGRGSVYKLIPSVLQARSRTLEISDAERRNWSDAMTGALIALAGTIGALGAMGTNLALRQSYASTGTETPAFVAFLVCYLGATIVTWARYLRPHHRTQTPS
jgi:NNP family nitrate/nitrite transporter-like MFS transporter